PDRRLGLDRDRAGHLRLLAADALPGRRVLLRRFPGAAVHLAGARRDRRAGALPVAPVRDDDRRAGARLLGGRAASAWCACGAWPAVRPRGALTVSDSRLVYSTDDGDQRR